MDYSEVYKQLSELRKWDRAIESIKDLDTLEPLNDNITNVLERFKDHRNLAVYTLLKSLVEGSLYEITVKQDKADEERNQK